MQSLAQVGYQSHELDRTLAGAPKSLILLESHTGFPGGSDGKESARKVGGSGLIPGLGRFPEGGHGNPLQRSCLENPMDRGAWRATVSGVTKSRTRLK